MPYEIEMEDLTYSYYGLMADPNDVKEKTWKNIIRRDTKR